MNHANTLRRLAGNRRVAVVAFGIAVLAIVGILQVADPYAADSLLPACPFHALTGLYCPGCGTTRALHALLHGDPLQAWRMNALAMLALLLLPALLWRWLRPGVRAGWLTDARLWLVLVLAFTALRNIPLPAFAWLAPASPEIAQTTEPTVSDTGCDGCRRGGSAAHRSDAHA